MAFEQLRAFQEEDVADLQLKVRKPLYYQQRLGKTVVGVWVTAKDPMVRNTMICCPRNALFVWRAHLHDMLPKLGVTDYAVTLVAGGGSKEFRQQLYRNGFSRRKNYFITTYDSLRYDVVFLETSKIIHRFNALLCDESKRLRNRRIKRFDAVKRVARVVQRFHAMDGTQANKGPQDFWGVFNLSYPQRFRGYWKYVNEWCVVEDTPWGPGQILGAKDLEAFAKWLRSECIIRFRKDPEVASNIPPVERSAVPVELSPTQMTWYSQLEANDFVVVGDEMIIAGNSLEKALRYRQLLTCPEILFPDCGEPGGALEACIEEIQDAGEKHAVIYTDFKAAFDPFEKYLRGAGLQYVYRLSGGIDAFAQDYTIKEWRRTGGVLMCTIPYAESFSLEPAPCAYFIGMSWDPTKNQQAEDRLLPQEGVNPIGARYFTYAGTYDEHVVDVVGIKHDNIHIRHLGREQHVTTED